LVRSHPQLTGNTLRYHVMAGFRLPAVAVARLFLQTRCQTQHGPRSLEFGYDSDSIGRLAPSRESGAGPVFCLGPQKSRAGRAPPGDAGRAMRLRGEWSSTPGTESVSSDARYSSRGFPLGRQPRLRVDRGNPSRAGCLAARLQCGSAAQYATGSNTRRVGPTRSRLT
jgi:hypothetical protein